jgi:transcriptional regulator with XRE-family HTH domain
MKLKEVFGGNLRQYRKAAKLSQAELADDAGFSSEMISRMERGITAPAFETIELLAESLGVPEAAFFGTAIMTAPAGDRGRLLQKINLYTSKMNEKDLARLIALMEALRT